MAELAVVIKRVGKTQDEIFRLLDAFSELDKVAGNTNKVGLRKQRDTEGARA